MLAVALSSLLVIESVTYRIRRRPTRRDLDKDVRAALMSLQRRLAQSTDNAEPAPDALEGAPSSSGVEARHEPTGSAYSSAQALLDRFEEDGGQACAMPLPLKTEAIDDMISPALAAATYPQVSRVALPLLLRSALTTRKLLHRPLRIYSRIRPTGHVASATLRPSSNRGRSCGSRKAAPVLAGTSSARQTRASRHHGGSSVLIPPTMDHSREADDLDRYHGLRAIASSTSAR
jgi:hypothetical protein